MFTTIQEGIQAIQKQVLSDTPPEHALYIPAQGKRTTYATEDAFDLYPAVNEFLKFPVVSTSDQKDSKDQKTQIIDNGRKVLLLLGDAGSGKSLFCQDLIARLWQSYKPGNPIPLFISLARLQDPIDNAIEETLTVYGFSAEQIATLKKEQQFIFVLDGYDEIHQFKNLYVTNKLNEWQARTIITCRSQYLYYLNDTDKYFMPFHGEKRQPQLLQQFYVAPFSEKEIVAYVKQYEKLNRQAVVVDIKDHKSDIKGAETPKPVLYQQLISIPGLQSLVTTPFLLHLAAEALPDILVRYKDSKDQKNTEQQKLTQAALYDVFIERWFKRQELKLKTSKHIDEKAADPKPNFWKFCKELAVTMRTQNVTLINYTPEKVSKFASATAQAKLNPWKQFFSEEKDVELLRSACPIRKLGPNQYGFIHASLIEFFATRAMYEEVIAQQLPSVVISAVAPKDSKDEKSFAVKTEQAVQTNLISLPQNTLYQSSITKQNNMIQFLADRVQESEVFKNKLFEAIEHSKKDERYAVGAANAITALNCAEINFNGMEFKGIKIPEANLSGSLCDRTNFQNADLRGVNFQKTWLRNADLSGANVAGIHFGEQPSIKPLFFGGIFSYSPDGLWLAIADVDMSTGKEMGVITLYDIVTRAITCSFKGHTGSKISCLSWDARSERLASGSDDNTVRIWNITNGKELICFAKHQSKINSVAWNPSNSDRLASGSDDKTVRIWDITQEKEQYCFDWHTEEITSICWDPKGERLACGSKDHSIWIWDVATGKVLSHLIEHSLAVTSVSWHGAGKWLASGSDDNTVRVWDVDSGKVLHCLTGHSDGAHGWSGISSVAWDMKGEYLASAGADRTVRLWSAATGKEFRCLTGQTEYVICISWDNKNQCLASGSVDGIRIWEIAAGKELRTFNGHENYILDIALNVKHQQLASGSIDKSVRIWEAGTGKMLQCLLGHTDRVESVAWDSKGERVASGSGDGTIRIWQVITAKELQCIKDCSMTIPNKELLSQRGYSSEEEFLNSQPKVVISAIAWNVNTNHLAAVHGENAIRIWDVVANKELRLITEVGMVTCIAWDPKGERLAAATLNNENQNVIVTIWNVVTGNKIHNLIAHKFSVNQICWEANGEQLSTSSSDNTIRIWDAATGAELKCLSNMSFLIPNAKRTLVASTAETSEHSNYFESDADLKPDDTIPMKDNNIRISLADSGQELCRLTLPERIRRFNWLYTVSGEELLAVVFGNNIACFTLRPPKSTKESWQPILHWLVASSAISYLQGLNFTNARGLSEANHEFLIQRDAIEKPAAIEELLSPAVTDEKEHSPGDIKVVIAATPLGSASSTMDHKSTTNTAITPTPAQLVVQHSPIFSLPARDAQLPSSAVALSDVKLDAKQSTAAAVEIDNTNADKPKNDSSCAPCCSLM